MPEVDEEDRITRQSADALPTIAIVGAGCAGTLVAANLLRGGGALRVVLIERSGRFGPGVAYSTRDPQHRLNVVAEHMSAFPDEREHFADWTRDVFGPQPPGTFQPRMRFGQYLRETLAAAERDAAPGSRLERVTGEVVDLVMDADGLAVTLADGRRRRVDRAVLALGSLPPAAPVPLPTDPRVIADPWAEGALDGLGDGTTLLIGAGLTAIDVALSACDRPRGRVIAISRSAQFPFEQLPGIRTTVPPPPAPPAPTTVDRLERWLAGHVAAARRAGHDWRDAIDGLRPELDRLWQSLPTAERERFLRERWRAWEVRRHRMAPATGERIRSLLGEGRLRVQAGRVVDLHARPSGVDVRLVAGTLRADRVVVCAGAGTDVRGAPVPLLRALLRRGLASPDPLALGLRATADGSLLAADGRPQPSIRLLGALRRGDLWETTALNEIRAQAQAIARTLVPVPHSCSIN